MYTCESTGSSGEPLLGNCVGRPFGFELWCDASNTDHETRRPKYDHCFRIVVSGRFAVTCAGLVGGIVW